MKRVYLTILIFVFLKVGGHTQPIKMPEGIRRDQFLAGVEALTDQNSPDWLGLPNNAEKVVFLSSF